MAMKVMLVNGSPHKNGCTNRALDEIEGTLAAEGIEVGRFWVGTKPIAGCIGCAYCRDHGGQCVFNDIVNRFNEIAGDYDGFIFCSLCSCNWRHHVIYGSFLLFAGDGWRKHLPS